MGQTSGTHTSIPFNSHGEVKFTSHTAKLTVHIVVDRPLNVLCPCTPNRYGVFSRLQFFGPLILLHLPYSLSIQLIKYSFCYYVVHDPVAQNLNSSFFSSHSAPTKFNPQINLVLSTSYCFISVRLHTKRTAAYNELGDKFILSASSCRSYHACGITIARI